MNFDKILETVTNKLPDILLGIVIFIVFWIMSKVFKTMVYRVLNKKSPNSNISLILSSDRISVIFRWNSPCGETHLVSEQSGRGRTKFLDGGREIFWGVRLSEPPTKIRLIS